MSPAVSLNQASLRNDKSALSRLPSRSLSSDNYADAETSECQLSSLTQAIEKAILSRDMAMLQEIVDEKILIRDCVNITNHVLLCGDSLLETLTLLSSMKEAMAAKLQQTRHETDESAQYILLMKNSPTMAELMSILSESGDFELLDNVFFIVGSATKCSDLTRAAPQRAQSVIILSQDAAGNAQGADDSEGKDGLADFAAISSLLTLELAYQLESGPKLRIRRLPSRRNGSSANCGFDGPSGVTYTHDAEASLYQREIDQGLPQESVKLRVLERFPDLDPSILNADPDVLEDTLKRYGSRFFYDDGFEDPAKHLENVIVVLTSASSIKFCGPSDQSQQEQSNPYFTPLFAAGQVLVLSLFDRVVCHSFYNPYMLELIEALAGGGDIKTNSGPACSCGCLRSQRSRLSMLPIQNNQIGMDFGAVFLDLLKQECLAIGIYRAPDTILGNVLPFAYSCPTADTILNVGDALFVLSEMFFESA